MFICRVVFCCDSARLRGVRHRFETPWDAARHSETPIFGEFYFIMVIQKSDFENFHAVGGNIHPRERPRPRLPTPRARFRRESARTCPREPARTRVCTAARPCCRASWCPYTRIQLETKTPPRRDHTLPYTDGIVIAIHHTNCHAMQRIVLGDLATGWNMGNY